MTALRTSARQYWVAVRAVLVLTAILGIVYPLTIMVLGQIALPAQANGSLIVVEGSTRGSSLLGQSFTDARGVPRPEWFQPRPSAGGYDGAASGGSNLGPENADLVSTINSRRQQIAELNGVPPESVPVDALTASASGLDPHISPAYARLQANRVAAARGLSLTQVEQLVESRIQGPDLGFLGEPTVNVLELNLALSALER
ncbi:potassium transporter KtrA [Cryobacterium sp. MLB-32]|uniref:potassium-transporting ATPase subunit KdpC n=1 Tax=Cryobacterium sp. MLB-32 TaxID=1529318 RepID=UPI0004E65576|nr:potassium-transporting ATPase subunit KdpC [Cryobacterium sp. MLB-32]KFF60805.1 potassium transporter KtrA [Cryobacterium sp. MLB-32]